MGNIVFGNYGKTEMSGSVAAVDTAITVNDASGFPALVNAGDFFQLTFVRLSDNAVEIVKVTNVAANVITCVRGQEGTTALALVANDAVQVWLTAGAFDNVVLKDSTGDAFIANDNWYKASNNAGTGFVNIAKVTTGDLLQIGDSAAQVIFHSSSAEAMRIDASQNLLYGKTVSGISTAGGEMRTNGEIFCTRSAASPFSANRLTDSGPVITIYKDSVISGNIGSQGNDMSFGSGASGEAMRINASQQVLINKTTSAVGTAGVVLDDAGNIMTVDSAPALTLNRTGSDGHVLDMDNDSVVTGRFLLNGAGVVLDAVAIGGTHQWRIEGTEAMRITSTQDLLLGKTSAGVGTAGVELQSGGQVIASGNAGSIFTGYRSTSTTTNTLCQFRSNVGGTNVSKWQVLADGDTESSTGVYTTISDRKFKENEELSGSQWDDVKLAASLMKKFDMKDGTGRYLGWVAQDLQRDEFPGLVKVNPETTQEDYQETITVQDEDGNDVEKQVTRSREVETGETYLSVRESLIYKKSVKALGEAMIRIEELETKVAALEA